MPFCLNTPFYTFAYKIVIHFCLSSTHPYIFFEEEIERGLLWDEIDFELGFDLLVKFLEHIYKLCAWRSLYWVDEFPYSVV